MQTDHGVSFFLLGNIPGGFRSYTLRAYFSHLVEKEAFVCFHFKHRPEFRHRRKDTPTIIHAQTDEDGSTVKEKDAPISNTPADDVNKATPTSDEKTTLTTQKDISESEEICKEKTEKKSDETINTHIELPHNEDAFNNSDTTAAAVKARTQCCLLSVKTEHANELMSYNGKNWTNINDELMRERVRLQVIKIINEEEENVTGPCSRQQQNNCFSSQLIHSLPEFNPPSSMPHGNVGTSLRIFRELIRSCRLPPSVIKKLRLVFPTSLKCYGAVPLDYATETRGISLSEMRKREGHTIKSTSSRKKRKIVKEDQIEEDEGKQEEEEEDEEQNEYDDYGAEDWERYEALHDDADKQERTTERLFEEEMEVTWDKGSSGLVFYTDASYWDQQDGDFDEQCSKEDDWDVDMSLYYGYESADKQARDMRDMAIERRLRAGEDLEDIYKKKPTENFGRKLMEEKGWREGTGLGPSSSGIARPLEAEGQSSHCKAGLGYRGEKLNLKPQPKKKTREVLIPTIYDEKDEEKDTLLTRAPSTTLKYREKSFPFIN